jgi:hypothetical protein
LVKALLAKHKYLPQSRDQALPQHTIAFIQFQGTFVVFTNMSVNTSLKKHIRPTHGMTEGWITFSRHNIQPYRKEKTFLPAPLGKHGLCVFV